MDNIEAKKDSAPELGLTPGSAPYIPTPGPWCAYPECKGEILSHGTVVGKAMRGSRSGYEQFANARLMAAAPELFAALTLVLETSADEHGIEEVKRRVAIAEAALAKARVQLKQNNRDEPTLGRAEANKPKN